MQSILLSFITLSSVLALPGIRQPQHQHHKRDIVTVYQTVMVTEWHTETAKPVPVIPLSTTTQAAAVTVPYVAPVQSSSKSSSSTTPVFVAPTSSSTTPVVAATTLRTSSVPATTAATVASAVKASGSKRGIAWPSSNPSSMSSLFSKGPLSWYYNWGTGATSGMSLTHIYQQWSGDNLGNVKSLPQGSVLLGFNEPDHGGQAAMSPAQAAAIYKSTLTPLRKTGQISYLGSPATTNGGGGLPWLTEFMSLCSDCQIDFISAHWYGPSMTLFESQLNAIHAAFNKPVWLTEFACTNWNPASNPSNADIANFMAQSMAWLESTSWIEKYAWFGALQITDASLGTGNMLVTSDGSSLSALGRQYMS